jgi:hypothetical protein
MAMSYQDATRIDRPSSLEATLEGARLAFACPYSSSAEYEAATIAVRRAAGDYREPALARGMALGGIVTALALVFLVVF